MKSFVNRTSELAQLNRHHKSGGGFVMVYGRRRVGKTALLVRWLEGHKNAAYSQAVEAQQQIQMEQLAADVGPVLGFAVPPRDWAQFFSLLRAVPAPWVLCLDEFQYLVNSAPELPSFLQKFLDHQLPDSSTIIVAGSSQSMMHGLVMDNQAPLYGRSDLVLRVLPMDFRHFCKSSSFDRTKTDSLLAYCLTGGLPRNWKLLSRSGLKDPVEIADTLYFEPGAPMEEEPDHILKDEGSAGKIARSILECIGRGSHKISEIAGRLEQPATNFSRPLKMLLDLGLVRKDLPFGVSERESKSSLYRLADPVLHFWFSVYSPHRSRWYHMNRAQRLELIRGHARNILEQILRDQHPGARRYWEKAFEWDIVREEADKNLVISEIKFGQLAARERKSIEDTIASQFRSSQLSKRYKLKAIEVLDVRDALLRL